MRELPRVNIYEDFYMWFDLEEKKEHYSTPLYLYNVERNRIDPNDEIRLYLKLEEDISKTKLNKRKEIEPNVPLPAICSESVPAIKSWICQSASCLNCF